MTTGSRAEMPRPVDQDDAAMGDAAFGASQRSLRSGSKRSLPRSGSSQASMSSRQPSELSPAESEEARFINDVVLDVRRNSLNPEAATRQAIQARLRRERSGFGNARQWQIWLRDEVVRHPLFDAFILVCIILNSVTLAMSNPLMDPNSDLAGVLEITDVVFTGIFTIEMLTKMFALGVFDGKVCGLRCCGEDVPLFGGIISLPAKAGQTPVAKPRAGGGTAIAPISSAAIAAPPALASLPPGTAAAPSARPMAGSAMRLARPPRAEQSGSAASTDTSAVRVTPVAIAGHGVHGVEGEMPSSGASSPVAAFDENDADLGAEATGIDGAAASEHADGGRDDAARGGQVDESEHLEAIEERVRAVVDDAAEKFPRAYLGSPWNGLDFIIVVAALLGYIPAVGAAGGSGVRLMRVLRPLRSVNRLPSLRVIISTMLDSFRGMVSVMVLVLFLFVIYGIVGVLFFNGALHQRCYDAGSVPPAPPPFAPEEDTYALDGYCSTMPGFAYQCPAGQTCSPRAEDPQYGWVSFDNIGLAFLAIYNVISMSNWAPLSYQISDTTGSFGAVFFVTLILFGTFFSINIVLAVVVASYEENFSKQQTRDRQAAAMDLLATRESRHSRVIAVLRRARGLGKVHIDSIEVNADDVDAQGGTYAMSNSDDEDAELDLPPPRSAGAQVAPSQPVTPNGSRNPSLGGGDRGGANDDGGPVTMGSIRSQQGASFGAASGANSPPGSTRPGSRATSRGDGASRPPSIGGGGGGDGGAAGDSKATRDSAPDPEGSPAVPDGDDTPGLPMPSHDEPQKPRQPQQHQVHQGVSASAQSSVTAGMASSQLPAGSSGTHSEVPPAGQAPGASAGPSLPPTGAAAPSLPRLPEGVPTPAGGASPVDRKEVASPPSSSASTKGAHVAGAAGATHSLQPPTAVSGTLLQDAARLVFGAKADHAHMRELAEAERRQMAMGGRDSRASSASDSGLSEEERIVALAKAGKDDGAGVTPGAARDVPLPLSVGPSGDDAPAPSGFHPAPAAGRRKRDHLKLDSDAGAGAGAGARAGAGPGGAGRAPVSPLSPSERRRAELVQARQDEAAEQVEERAKRRKEKRQAKLRRQWAAAARIVLRSEEKLRSQRAWLRGKPRPIHWLNTFVRSGVFSAIIVIAIVINTILLAMDAKDNTRELDTALEQANVVLTAIFTAEMVLKLAGLGPRVYASDAFNVFDGIIVVTSLVELIVAAASPSGESGSIVGLFRTFRLLRVLKLAKSVKTLRILLVTTINSLPDIGWMSLVLVLFLFIFAVLGVQLFAGALAGLPSDPPYSFDDLFNSLFSVFQVLTGDDWTSIMADTAHATSGAAILYFVLLHAFGSYIVLSLFVAILLQRFSDQQDAAFDEEDYSEMGVLSLERSLLARDPTGFMAPPPTDKASSVASTREAANDIVAAVGEVVEEMQARDLVRRRQAKNKKDKHNNKDPGPGIVVRKPGETASASIFKADPHNRFTREDGAEFDEVLHGLNGSVCGCFHEDNCLRIGLFRLVTSSWFEVGVLIAILVNCVFLALESPDNEPTSVLSEVLATGDVVFAVLFTVEASFKIAAFGIWKAGPHAYLRSAWNVLDFFIVVVSLLSLALPDVSALRSLRALRPLRVVVRSPQIQVVIRALVYALPNIFNVFVLTMLLWLIFAILGVNQFKGTFSSCTDPGLDKAACVGMFVDESGANATRVWDTPVTNFDSVGPAMLTLFQVATLSDWATVARLAIAATGTDSAPKDGTNPLALLYFFAFIVVGSFFSLNLFIGVVIDNFNRLKKELDGSAFMTKEQRQLANADKLIRTVKIETRPEAPSASWRRVAFRIIMMPWFDPFIFGVIIANALTMCMQFYGMDAVYAAVLDGLNTAFLVIFGIEAVLKLSGLGIEVYWRSLWNRFDFIVFIASVIGVFFDAGAGASVIRVLRIARIIRIARVGMLRQLLTTLLNSVPSLWNIGGLLFVLFFIFATLGTNLFGRVPFEDVNDLGVSRHANFRNFGMSIFALWRVATGDAWEGLLYSTMAFSPTVAVVYFVVFQVGVAFVMINLFIAVILENFEESNEEEKGDSRLDEIHGWAEIWNKFDPLALKWVPVALFPRLMASAPRPFGFGRLIMRPSTVIATMAQLRVPLETRPASLFNGKIGSRILSASRASNPFQANFEPLPADGAHVFSGRSSKPQTLANPAGAPSHAASTASMAAPGSRTNSKRLGVPSDATAPDAAADCQSPTPMPEPGIANALSDQGADDADDPTSPLDKSPGSRRVWCVNLTATLKALAAVVAHLDVKLESEAGRRRYFAHEWLFVRMVETVAVQWLRRRRLARSAGSFKSEAGPGDTPPLASKPGAAAPAPRTAASHPAEPSRQLPPMEEAEAESGGGGRLGAAKGSSSRD
ncbi:hypothetical protein FNF28_04736 [Cafeteria roenbergensis]|uniref:Ion transport domain-containing protein n=1 Tax=Cafeteria roenbergensis TaxID=33653 RepID=A0A5A8DAW8_CAFRO|nr:hypothetical protein FNF28_04736 [Cafeteria roenbergensis]